MSHIFGFHKGHNNNILGWERADRIVAGDINEITDKTDIISSSAGSSIPTPVARMFLFKAAFDFMSSQMLKSKKDDNGIYAGLISETLDLLELLFKSGSNTNQLRYENWVFNEADSKFFGNDRGHQLLTESFKQAGAQQPFNHKMEITLIYYKEGNREVLLGGTSPFTFVFTSPNFKRKIREKGIKSIYGLTSDEPLFTGNYKQLHERDSSFIWYVENLVHLADKKGSFGAFTNYVVNTRKQYERNDPRRFDAEPVNLQAIQYSSDIPLSVSGVYLEQISEKDYQSKIEKYSDFKLDLPGDSPYRGKSPIPLFLYSHMDLDGQYTSPTNNWSNKIAVSALFYPETTLEEINIRELPGIKGIKYPFLSKFDFFEKSLVTLPGYSLDDDRFETLTDNQNFILPVKPLFFQFFPLSRLSEYIKITRALSTVGSEPEITVQITIPIYGPTMMKRRVVLKQVYKREPVVNREDDKDKYPFTDYKGILGIFPFIKTGESDLKYINSYTVASYEKTNDGDPLANIKFLKSNGTDDVKATPTLRSEYTDVNTRTSYYQVKESFEVIQLNFIKNNTNQGGLIIPKFKNVTNGAEEYVYAIDFGTSNTHIEFARVDNNKANKEAVDVKPFEISEHGMIMTMLNKPAMVKEQDGTADYKDYTRFGSIVDSVKVISLREFMPFQIGPQKAATTKFPFRTATFETRNFKESRQPLLFTDANIGFNIDRDILVYNQGYQTNIKWQLESNLNDTLKQNRIKIFFRQLLLMIRSHALLITSPNPSCNLNLLKIAMSFPISMESALKKNMTGYFVDEMNAIFNIKPNKDDDDPDTTQNRRFIEVTESIAPYYQLLKDNNSIKHNIYCNIDIGGGTSDIVLVDKNDELKLLNCYCNSVRFAGKQLWGSVSDDYNPDDNGFVLYYLKMLQSRNRNEFEKLRNMIGAKSNRTEDIVSYLFSDDSYNFKQIFTDCKELKVPLLLHYTALLYFVAKSCKLKPVKLPKTLSFSGKGSEYISIIFNSNEHLRVFTKKALMLFSGLDADQDFKIKKSTNPKVITAQGSAVYGANPLAKKEKGLLVEDKNGGNDELQIYPIADKYYGLTDKDTNNADKKTYSYFEEHNPGYESVMLNCVEFLETFFADTNLIAGSEDSLNIDNLGKYKSFFIKSDASFDIFKSGVLRDSYKSALEEKDMQKEAADSPFFFAFNTSLIELSKFIAREDLKKKGLSS